MQHVRRHRTLSSISIAIAVFAVAVALFWRTGRDEIEERVVDPAENPTALPTAPAVSAEERAFYDYIGPRLSTMTAEARELDRLGQARSRDLVSLQVRSDRVFTLATEIDAYIAANPVPDRFTGVVTRYRAAVAEMRFGSDTARAAFFRLDWDAVASGLASFGKGASELDAAYAEIRAVAGSAATPISAGAQFREAA